MTYLVHEAGLTMAVCQTYEEAAEWCRLRLERHPFAHAEIHYNGRPIATTRSGSLIPRPQ